MEKKKNNDKKSLRIILPNFIKSTWKSTFRWRLKITRKKIQHSETMQLLKFICCMLKMWTLNQQALPVRCAHSSVTQPTFFSMSKVCHTKKDWLVFFLLTIHTQPAYSCLLWHDRRGSRRRAVHISHTRTHNDCDFGILLFRLQSPRRFTINFNAWNLQILNEMVFAKESPSTNVRRKTTAFITSLS